MNFSDAWPVWVNFENSRNVHSLVFQAVQIIKTLAVNSPRIQPNGLVELMPGSPTGSPTGSRATLWPMQVGEIKEKSIKMPFLAENLKGFGRRRRYNPMFRCSPTRNSWISVVFCRISFLDQHDYISFNVMDFRLCHSHQCIDQMEMIAFMFMNGLSDDDRQYDLNSIYLNNTTGMIYSHSCCQHYYYYD